jgi:hypothetical protein
MPDFTVIEGGGPEGRDRILAEQEFKFALRQTAANMLRIIRGAGKPFELLTQMSDVVELPSRFGMRPVYCHMNSSKPFCMELMRLRPYGRSSKREKLTKQQLIVGRKTARSPEFTLSAPSKMASYKS